MCAHCTAANHEAPTRRDMDNQTAELMARPHDHDPYTCRITRCGACWLHWGYERLADESRAERDYDAREAS